MADMKNTVADVKSAYDIVEYIQSHGVQLKSNGVNKYKGLCPFHNEKTPSFVVDSHFQNYRCFGCSASGDIIQYAQATEHLEFVDALRSLAEDKGITVNIGGDSENSIDYKSLRECMREISNFFLLEFKKLDNSHPAKQEVIGRGLQRTNVRYGYAPEGRRELYNHLKKIGFTDETILLTGACIQFKEGSNIGDFWNGRLMFFITDITGKPIGWAGRKLYESDQRGKFVNSKDGVLFDKGASLFNISNAKKTASEDHEVLVAEGQFDVAALDCAGMPNTVASSGTAFTQKQAMMLRRMVTENGKIVFCFDGDAAGMTAVEKIFANVPLIHSQAYIVSFPEALDPCDYRAEHGNEGLKGFVEESRVPLTEFVLSRLEERFDLSDEMVKSQFIEAAAKVLKTLSNHVLRESYIKKVSLDTFVSVDVIKEAIDRATPINGSGNNTDNKPNSTAEEIDDSDGRADNTLKETETAEEYAEKMNRRLKNDAVYVLSARMISLAFADANIVSELETVKEELPGQFSTVVDELCSYDTSQPIIIERFTNSALAKMLTAQEIFPFWHLMQDDDKKHLFTYLLRELRRENDQRKTQNVRTKISHVLQKSPDQGYEFLTKAIEAEEKELDKKSENVHEESSGEL